MAFTFDLASLDAAVGKQSLLRLLVGDATENAGPRPGQANFSDEELRAFLDLEGSLRRGQAAVLEALSAQWAQYAGTYRLGPESVASQAAARYGEEAERLRKQYGRSETTDTTDNRKAFSVGVTLE